MKRFIQIVAAIKTTAAFSFTGATMWVTVISMFFGNDSLPIRYIWQIVFLAMIFAVLEFLLLSENRIGRMGTTARIAFLGLAQFVVMAVFAIAFHWFGTDRLTNWLAFTGLYIALFLIGAFVLRTTFRLGGMQYRDMLTAYKERR